MHINLKIVGGHSQIKMLRNSSIVSDPLLGRSGLYIHRQIMNQGRKHILEFPSDWHINGSNKIVTHRTRTVQQIIYSYLFVYLFTYH